MSVTATGTFLTGTKQSIVIIDNTTGAQVQLDGKRRMMESSAKDEVVTSAPIDGGGVVDHEQIPGGWTGSIEVEKANANFSTYVKLLDAAFYAGLSSRRFTIVETILPVKPGDAVEQNTFVDVVFHGYKAGQWSRTSITLPHVDFSCSQRV